MDSKPGYSRRIGAEISKGVNTPLSERDDLITQKVLNPVYSKIAGLFGSGDAEAPRPRREAAGGMGAGSDAPMGTGTGGPDQSNLTPSAIAASRFSRPPLEIDLFERQAAQMEAAEGRKPTYEEVEALKPSEQLTFDQQEAFQNEKYRRLNDLLRQKK